VSRIWYLSHEPHVLHQFLPFRSIVQALRMDRRDVVRGARLTSAQLFALQRIGERLGISSRSEACRSRFGCRRSPQATTAVVNRWR
jgi:hypothetical protein